MNTASRASLRPHRASFDPRETGASALFLTAGTAGALPLLNQLLIDSGLDRNALNFLGLTRWDVPARTLGLPSIPGRLVHPARSQPLCPVREPLPLGLWFGTASVAGLAYDGVAAIGALARQGSDGTCRSAR